MKSQANNGCFELPSAVQNGKRCTVNGARLAALLFFVFSCTVYRASCTTPPKEDLTYESTMIGIGKSSVYDTYLSPLKYKGINQGIIYEQMKRTGLWNGNVAAQHLFYIELAETKNPTETATSYAGNLEYGYGLHYRFKPVQKIQFFAGLQFAGLLGGIYNTRNGNNPVAAKANLNLNLSGMAAYRLQIGKQPVQLRYQLNVPVVGMQFSPEFGQSYYEIDLGVNAPLVHLASFHNQFILRSLFSVELPFSFCTLRLSYMNWVYETRINDLNTQILSGSFYIGFSKNFFTVRGRKSPSDFQPVF